MPVIKRYPNRKLYNTEAKQYITLDGIAQLIRAGDDVVVVDNVTGEDLTAVTLTQIIFEQEKKQGGFLPQSVLTGLIQAGGNRLGNLRRTITLPLDVLRHVDGEIERRVHHLINRGELAREEGLHLRDKLLALGRTPASDKAPGDDEVAELLAAHDIPTRDDLADLLNQLEALTLKLETLTDDNPPT